MGAVADGFTRVITHPSVDRGEWIVRNKLTPGLLVPAGGRMGKPGLDVLPGRATGIAGRQQIDVDGPVLADRPGPGPPMQQVCKGRDILRRSGCAWTDIPVGVLVTRHIVRIRCAGERGVAAITALDGKIVWVACLESCAGGARAVGTQRHSHPGNRTMVPGIS